MDITLQAPADQGCGGLIGGPNSNGGAITDSASLTKGSGYTIAGFDNALGNINNIYEHKESTADSNSVTAEMKVDLVDRDFIVTTLGMDETIWNRKVW